jgi:hypothetical protein
MATGKQIAGVMVAATIVATLFSPMLGIVASSSGTQTVDNTTFTADIGDPVELPGYDVTEGTLTVEWYNSTSGSYEQVDDSYWNFSYPRAELTVENGTKISQGDDMRASYDYQATDGTTTNIVEMVPMFMALTLMGMLGNEISKRT